MKNIHSDFSIYEEFNKIYETQAKEIFDLERSEEEFAIQKKYYDKYFQQCVQNLSEVDMSKIGEECGNIEMEIKSKISEIELIDQNFKKLAAKEKIESNSNSSLDSQLLNQKFFQEYQIIQDESNSLRERLIKIDTRMKNLENQSLDSIKKVKNSFESEDDFYKSDFYKNLSVNKKELEALLINLEKKKKMFDEKLDTLKVNEFKVNKLKKEFNLIEEQSNQSLIQNDLLHEEINSYRMNLSLIAGEISKFEKMIEIKKNIITGKSKVKLILDGTDEESMNAKKILTDNINSSRDIENSLMLREDFTLLNKANNLKQFIRNEKRCNILSLFGVILNNKNLMNKRIKVKNLLNSSEKSIEEINKINYALDNLSSVEDSLRLSVDEIQNYKEKLQSLKFIERKREKVIKKIKLNR